MLFSGLFSAAKGRLGRHRVCLFIRQSLGRNMLDDLAVMVIQPRLILARMRVVSHYDVWVGEVVSAKE